MANSAHGGADGGASASDGTVEKDINLAIALKLGEFMRINGYKVIMTRTEDSSTDNSASGFYKKGDLQNRVKLMEENPEAVFVSIHLNKFTTSAARGTQVFYSRKAQGSKELGDSIRQWVKQLLQPENNRPLKMGNSSTYILENATVPTVIVECGFLSNSYDLQQLKIEEYQNKIAFAIGIGILNFKGMI